MRPFEGLGGRWLQEATCVTCCLWNCRLFLRKLKDELKIPVLALVDSDPYGLKILSVFMKGMAAGCCQAKAVGDIKQTPKRCATL